jgi:hypothetical protein
LRSRHICRLGWRRRFAGRRIEIGDRLRQVRFGGRRGCQFLGRAECMRLVLALLHVGLVLGRRAFALPPHAIATAAAAAATASPPVAIALRFAALRRERLVCLRRAFVGRRLLGTLGAEFPFGLARLIQTTFFRRMFFVTIVLTVRLRMRLAAIAATPPPTAPPPPSSAFTVLLGGGLCWRLALAFLV